MNLDQQTTDFITNVAKTAQLVDIDNVIIEPECVRGIDENQSVVLLERDNIMEMSFGSIGLNRISTFLSRYNVARTQDQFTIQATQSDDGQFVRALTLKGKNTKIDYRCASPKTIKAPKQIKDQMKVRVNINQQSIQLLQKGHTAMGGPDLVTIAGDEHNNVWFELVDVNNDAFKHTFAENIECLDDEQDQHFSFRYPFKVIASLFKNHPDGYFEVGQKGMLMFPISNLTVYILPQVG